MCPNRLLPVVVWAGSLVMALSGGAWAQIHSKPPFPYRRRSVDRSRGMRSGRRTPSLSRPLPAAQPRRMPQKATASSSRVCMSAVGWSGTAGSTRSSWTRRGHRLATYELNGGNRSRFRPSIRGLTPVVALLDPQAGGSVVAAHDLNALVPGVAHDVGLVDPAVLGFGDEPGPQRVRRIARCVLQTS